MPGDAQLIETIADHIARHFALVTLVFHEKASDDGRHIDVNYVAPRAAGRRPDRS